jgi:hypothetical protein
MHLPSEICIDSFPASRAPDLPYRTLSIGDLFAHAKGGFYHDGRFPTLQAVGALQHLYESWPQRARRERPDSIPVVRTVENSSQSISCISIGHVARW